MAQNSRPSRCTVVDLFPNRNVLVYAHNDNINTNTG